MNILVITYWKFDDALIQTYTLPYLRIMRGVLPAGSEITLITLEPAGEIKKEVAVESGIVRYSFRLHPFGLRAAVSWNSNLRELRSMVKRKEIGSIHTWCTPAGGIGTILSRKTGVPLVLDSFEPHAESMVETGTWKAGSIAFRVLFRMEKRQVHHAKWVIGVVAAMKNYAREKYGYQGDNFLVKPACMDFTQFNLQKRNNSALRAKCNIAPDDIVCIYAGKFGGLYMSNETFRFFKAAHDLFGDKFKVVILSSATPEEVRSFCIANSVDQKIIRHYFVSHSEVPEYMGIGDFAFSAIHPVPSKRYCTPIKNGEYWAMGLPVVIAQGISDDSDIIRDNDAGYVLRTATDEEFRKAAKEIKRILEAESPEVLTNRIHQIAQKHRNFEIAWRVYQTIYGKI